MKFSQASYQQSLQNFRSSLDRFAPEAASELNEVLTAVEKGQWDFALRLADSFRHAFRDDLPPELWTMMGGRLTKDRQSPAEKARDAAELLESPDSFSQRLGQVNLQAAVELLNR